MSAAAQSNLRPILKWAGGKRQLLHHLLPFVPQAYGRYIEPFVGGGALFFALSPQDCVLSDSNPELINFYLTLRDRPRELSDALSIIKVSSTTFYRIRALDVSSLGVVERAARFLFLNRTCYNGLYRVNRQGQFNVPFGRYKRVTMPAMDSLLLASKHLANSQVICADYKTIVRQQARPGDFVYFDPPYLPTAKFSDFKRYTSEQFYYEDHVELAQLANDLAEHGCTVLATNSNHPAIYDLYPHADISVVASRRAINKIAAGRSGEDAIIRLPPKRPLLISTSAASLASSQVRRFPATRFMGSKQRLLVPLLELFSNLKPRRAIDLFSGTGCVAYSLKALGVAVTANDFMHMNHIASVALVENQRDRLTWEELADALPHADNSLSDFMLKTFSGLYFSDEDLTEIARIRTACDTMSTHKRAIGITALIRACIKKRPRGIFTYTGFRYDDGRRDLKLGLREQVIRALSEVNRAVFNSGTPSRAELNDALNVDLQQFDLIYIDPPYYSPLSDNDYVRRYHFVEGLARNWKGVAIQEETQTRKFRAYPTPFFSERDASLALRQIFRDSGTATIVLSYSSNSRPPRDDLVRILSEFRAKVEVLTLPHRYSFGTQEKTLRSKRNEVMEYLFVGQ